MDVRLVDVHNPDAVSSLERPVQHYLVELGALQVFYCLVAFWGGYYTTPTNRTSPFVHLEWDCDHPGFGLSCSVDLQIELIGVGIVSVVCDAVKKLTVK